MTTDHNQHDEAVDNILAALRDAVPPAGMEARIAQRLAQNPAPASAFGRRGLFASPAMAATWGRGAATGAAAAMLVFGLLLSVTHLMQRHADHAQSAPEVTATNHAAPSASPVTALLTSAPTRGLGASPCATPAVLRASRIVATPSSNRLLAESTAPSRPAPPLPLTAQERGLLRLARTADPSQLATLNPEVQATLQAQDDAAFDKFFTPPPAPPTTEDGE